MSQTYRILQKNLDGKNLESCLALAYVVVSCDQLRERKAHVAHRKDRVEITHLFDGESENPEKELLIVLAIFGAFMFEQAIVPYFQYGIIQKSLDGKSLEEGKIMVNVTFWNGDADVAKRSFDSQEDAMQYIKNLREDGEWKIVYDGWSMTDEDGHFLIEEGEKVIWQTKRKNFWELL